METWVTRWGYVLRPEPLKPGVYGVQGGGFLLRAKVTCPRTGKTREVSRVLWNGSVQQATKAREAMIVEARAQLASPKLVPPLFYDYAVSLFERKVARERIRSAAGRSKWELLLRLHLYPAFGAFRVDQITRHDVDRWFTSYARTIKTGKLSPRTANTRLALLKVICRAASATYGFPDPTQVIEPFDTALHPTYTPEEPNSLTVDELPLFLNAMFERCPEHYAVTYLGFVTGLRPSTLFPLLIEEDVRWELQELWVRRSHTIGQEVMPTTKTGIGYPIGLPKEVLAVLRWHLDTQIEDGPMRASGLLFPSERGTIRFAASLGKPFARAALGAKLTKHVTPRAMRRTFQDITRAAEVESIVKRSISGHATEVMEGWYSTIAPDEQRRSLAKVIDLLDVKTRLAKLPPLVPKAR